MPMHPKIETIITREKENGRLAVAANLLFDIVFAGWIAFAGLYALEVLLPTFVMARLSLVKFALLLLILTSLLVWLGKTLEIKTAATANRKLSRPFLISLTLISAGIIALAHFRFPWWSIPVAILGYGLVLRLFMRDK